MPPSNNSFQAIADEKKIGVISLATGENLDYTALATIVENYRTVYVTVNKPAATIQEELTANEVDTDSMFFIDAVAEGDEAAADNVIYIESPSHLTNLSIAVTEFATTYEKEPKFLVFDSLSTLPTYVDEKLFERFTHHLIGRIRGWHMGAAFLCTPDVLDEKTQATINQLCDTVTA